MWRLIFSFVSEEQSHMPSTCDIFILKKLPWATGQASNQGELGEDARLCQTEDAQSQHTVNMVNHVLSLQKDITFILNNLESDLC